MYNKIFNMGTGKIGYDKEPIYTDALIKIISKTMNIIIQKSH